MHGNECMDTTLVYPRGVQYGRKKNLYECVEFYGVFLSGAAGSTFFFSLKLMNMFSISRLI